MSNDHARFAEWDAAYILGALTPTDRREYEAHLRDCKHCRQAIAEIASLPALLTGAQPVAAADDAVGAVATPPVDLVDRIRAREERRARTVRRRIAVAAVGAAATIALAIGIPMALGGPAPETTSVVLAAVVDTSLTASVELEGASWGTRISMDCDYPGVVVAPSYGSRGTYVLVVTDAAGNASQVSTWTAAPGESVQFDAATAVPLDQIRSIEIRSAEGDTILSSPVQR